MFSIHTLESVGRPQLPDRSPLHTQTIPSHAIVFPPPVSQWATLLEFARSESPPPGDHSNETALCKRHWQPNEDTIVPQCPPHSRPDNGEKQVWQQLDTTTHPKNRALHPRSRSVRFVLPRITTPAARRRATTVGILLGNIGFEGDISGSGAKSCNFEDVLDGDGHTM